MTITFRNVFLSRYFLYTKILFEKTRTYTYIIVIKKFGKCKLLFKKKKHLLSRPLHYRFLFMYLHVFIKIYFGKQIEIQVCTQLYLGTYIYHTVDFRIMVLK